MTVAPTWSPLKTLGQSRIVSLTVLVPFLGSLILFNENLAQLLYPAKQWVSEIASSANVDSFRWAFTISRLYCAYIGLTCLGVASFIFIILCPPIIKKYAAFEDYIKAQESIVTTPRLWIIQRENAENYVRNAVPSLNAAYPMSLAVLYENHIRTTFSSVPRDYYDASSLFR